MGADSESTTDLPSPAIGSLYLIENTVSPGVYIGKTMDIVEKRWSVHRSRLNRGVHHNRHLQNAWRKYGADAFVWLVVATHADKETLNQAEIALIAQCRASGIKTYNHTDGGDGGTGIQMTDETRRKISVITKERLADPEVNHRLREGLRRRYSDPEARARQREVMKATQTPEARAKKSQTLRQRYQDDPEYRATRLATLEFTHLPEARAKLAQSQIVAWQDPTIRQSRIEGQKQAFAKPEYKAMRSARSKRRYEDPATHDQVATVLRIPHDDPEVNARRLTALRIALAKRRGVSPMHYRYRLVSPEGEVFIVESLKQFCDEHGLFNGNMYAVLHGKRKQHHGWTVTKEPLPETEP